MRKAVVVIGCSYGDEGKGLATAFSAKRLGGKCLNIMINGGAQRGHTVDTPDGRRHVFHHFGSAAMTGAVSCADEDFIVNPLIYAQERSELADSFGLSPALLVSDRCRVTTPWDMMLGQIIEQSRGRARHGSCGMGIHETQLRYRETNWALRFGALAETDEVTFDAYCRRIMEEYVPSRLDSMGIKPDEAWRSLLRNPGVMRHFREDMHGMLENVQRYGDWVRAAQPFDTLLFEAGQGLALDAENKQDFPHLTPSRTTSLISAKRISALPGRTDTEVLYVTRSYLTRHGAGPFPTECEKARINPDMTDRTNIPNPHQQSLRYGFFDAKAVLSRVENDLRATRAILPRAVSAIMVTHLNETKGKLAQRMPLSDFTSRFDRVYLSDCPWSAAPAAAE